MLPFRVLLAAILIVIVVYTVFVVAEHGFNLVPVFFGDIARMGWPGQFNLDFLGMLMLSGLYLAWRHHFTAPGLALGLLGLVGGAPVLTAYLLVASLQARGDVAVLLLGPERAQALRGAPR